MRNKEVSKLILPVLTTVAGLTVGCILGKKIEERRSKAIMQDMYIVMGCSSRELFNSMIKTCQEAYFDWHSNKNEVKLRIYNKLAEQYNELINNERLLGKLGLEKTSERCELPILSKNDELHQATEYLGLLDEEVWKEKYFL